MEVGENTVQQALIFYPPGEDVIETDFSTEK